MATQLRPAAELAAINEYRVPNESPEYRRARNALLAEEIELRRHIERVAEQRRQLPSGGEVSGDYRFVNEAGETVSLADMFGDKLTLVVYSFMYGPKRARACPMCTATLGAWDGEVRDMDQRIALAVVARSPIDRLIAFKQERQWHGLKLYSDSDDSYSRDYNAIMPDGGDTAAINVFTRRDGIIRHFWAGEMGFNSADPGQDPRGAPDVQPMWTIFDMTPEGRDPDWYPKLAYDD